MDGCHANQGSLRFMLSKSKTTMRETQIYSRQERSDLNTRSDQVSLKYVRCKVIEDSRSMEDVTKWTRALDIGFSCMKVDPKWNQGDLWG